MLNGHISSTCHHNIVNIGALAAEIDSRVWGTTANCNRFRVLALIVTAATTRNGSQRNFARHLPSPGLAHYIQGLLPPDGILPRVKLTLRPSLAFSYTGSVNARHSSSQNLRRSTRNGTFAEGATYIRLGGHHVGCRPTFLVIFAF